MHTRAKQKSFRELEIDIILTDFLWQHLQVGHAAIFEELDAVHAIKAVIFDHVEGAVHS